MKKRTCDDEDFFNKEECEDLESLSEDRANEESELRFHKTKEN